MTKFFTENPHCETESMVIKLKEKYCSVIHNSDPDTIMEGIRAVGKTPELIANTPVEDLSAEKVEKEVKQCQKKIDISFHVRQMGQIMESLSRIRSENEDYLEDL